MSGGKHRSSCRVVQEVRKGVILSKDERDTVARLRANRMSWLGCAKAIGRSVDDIRSTLDPDVGALTVAVYAVVSAKEFPDREERSIMQRICDGSVAGVVRPAGQAAVMRLHKLGLVTFHWGSGKDEGVMLVRKAPDGRTPPYPTRGGGDVA